MESLLDPESGIATKPLALESVLHVGYGIHEEGGQFAIFRDRSIGDQPILALLERLDVTVVEVEVQVLQVFDVLAPVLVVGEAARVARALLAAHELFDEAVSGQFRI